MVHHLRTVGLFFVEVVDRDQVSNRFAQQFFERLLLGMYGLTMADMQAFTSPCRAPQVRSGGLLRPGEIEFLGGAYQVGQRP